ncbi:MAG TPA: hypothetical protein VD735_01395 [Candidatus Saccharimonadales bacterium]|nr:hypothetical protein [Candidatus Saccharimonadales bacterium]
MGLLNTLKGKVTEVLKDPVKRAKIERFAKEQAQKRFAKRR